MKENLEIENYQVPMIVSERINNFSHEEKTIFYNATEVKNKVEILCNVYYNELGEEVVSQLNDLKELLKDVLLQRKNADAEYFQKLRQSNAILRKQVTQSLNNVVQSADRLSGEVRASFEQAAEFFEKSLAEEGKTRDVIRAGFESLTTVTLCQALVSVAANDRLDQIHKTLVHSNAAKAREKHEEARTTRRRLIDLDLRERRLMLEQARQSLEEAAALNRTDYTIQWELANTCTELEDFAAAARAAQYAAMHSTTDFPGYNVLARRAYGLALDRLGRPAEGADEIEKALGFLGRVNAAEIVKALSPRARLTQTEASDPRRILAAGLRCELAKLLWKAGAVERLKGTMTAWLREAGANWDELISIERDIEKNGVNLLPPVQAVFSSHLAEIMRLKLANELQSITRTTPASSVLDITLNAKKIYDQNDLEDIRSQNLEQFIKENNHINQEDLKRNVKPARSFLQNKYSVLHRRWFQTFSPALFEKFKDYFVKEQFNFIDKTSFIPPSFNEFPDKNKAYILIKECKKSIVQSQDIQSNFKKLYEENIDIAISQYEIDRLWQQAKNISMKHIERCFEKSANAWLRMNGPQVIQDDAARMLTTNMRGWLNKEAPYSTNEITNALRDKLSESTAVLHSNVRVLAYKLEMMMPLDLKNFINQRDEYHKKMVLDAVVLIRKWIDAELRPHIEEQRRETARRVEAERLEREKQRREAERRTEAARLEREEQQREAARRAEAVRLEQEQKIRAEHRREKIEKLIIIVLTFLVMLSLVIAIYFMP